ncbi:GNAT family N-acetyltransferase [Spirosoma sp. SC4-14]|uniref:GNAT family N-acetyltransferase n=1 Tax=Spirosoma sp. SC4-14 TaxID=3128900 RepID=UPI0030D18460
MIDVQLTLNQKGHGSFFVADANGEKIAEMVISVSGDQLTVYHTEVSPNAQGKGLAGELLKTMVAYARAHQLKVIPLCPYVHAQFKRHPALYNDIWKQ